MNPIASSIIGGMAGMAICWIFGLYGSPPLRRRGNADLIRYFRERDELQRRAIDGYQPIDTSKGNAPDPPPQEP